MVSVLAKAFLIIAFGVVFFSAHFDAPQEPQGEWISETVIVGHGVYVWTLAERYGDGRDLRKMSDDIIADNEGLWVGRVRGDVHAGDKVVVRYRKAVE